MTLISFSNLRHLFFASIAFFILISSSCAPSKYLADDQALVTKVKLDSIDERFKEQAGSYVQKDIRPNSFINLRLYTLLNTKNGRYKTQNIKNIGQPPSILDSALVEISRKQIEKFLHTKGFLKAKVKSDIKVEDKKAQLTFTAEEGPEFKFRKIQSEIDDPAVEKLYLDNKSLFTHLKEGDRYDEDSLVYEREQIYQMMRRNGYYDYLRQYVRFDVDSNLYASQTDIRMFLQDPPNQNKHLVYTIDTSSVVITNSNGKLRGQPKSVVVDSEYVFKDYSRKFKPSRISKFMFIDKGDIYNVDRENLTYDRLYSLNVFKNIKIEYKKAADSSQKLTPTYEITPLKRMSNRIEGEYTFNSGRSGFNVGNTYSNRNLFGGAELLELKFRYGVLFDSRLSGSLFNRVYNRDLQLGANLTFPRLIVPFNIPQIGKNGVPHTTFASSLQLFDQTNTYSNRTFINSVTYNWVETKYKLHSLTPANIEYRNGKLDDAFKADLQAKGYEQYIRTNDRKYINFGSQYTYTYNAIKLSSLNNFFYFRGAADVAGNTLSLVSNVLNFKENADGNKIIFGLPYQQYSKVDLDGRIYRSLGGEKQLVFRLNPGIIIPYGNSDTLTFEKKFFAGGSSGIRAWQSRTLGPGNYNRANIDSTLRENLRNLDQLGEIRIESNLEYRFKIVNNFFGSKLKGATFTDFGNVWRIIDDPSTPGGLIKLNKLFDQIAIGAGAGLRFDVDYFVFRFDAGVKIKDPQFAGSDQWVIKNLFNSNFKDQYKATHFPDEYRFVQYNFGIGMPF